MYFVNEKYYVYNKLCKCKVFKTITLRRTVLLLLFLKIGVPEIFSASYKLFWQLFLTLSKTDENTMYYDSGYIYHPYM